MYFTKRPKRPLAFRLLREIEILSRREGAPLSQSSTYKSRILGLPEIRTPEDLAFLLRIPLSTVLSFAHRNWNSGYKTFTLRKKSGGHRQLHAPVRELKFIQAWILRNILSNLNSSRWSTAFEPGNSIAANASRHLNQAYIVNIDLKDFFPSIDASKVYQIFTLAGYNAEIAWLLTNLVTFRGALPQGSPSSPKLANLICHRLDARIAGYCQTKNLQYTRYADDITVSMPNRAHIKGTVRFLSYVADNEGFSIRPEKTAVFGRKHAKRITGLIVSDEVRIGRKKYREIRNLIYKSLLINDSEKKSYIDGYMNFLKDVDQKTYKTLHAYQTKLHQKFTAEKLTSGLLENNKAA
jgi:retron-type reverse transcriptase